MLKLRRRPSLGIPGSFLTDAAPRRRGARLCRVSGRQGPAETKLRAGILSGVDQEWVKDGATRRVEDVDARVRLQCDRQRFHPVMERDTAHWGPRGDAVGQTVPQLQEAGEPLTASMVANSVGTSAPLRGGRWMVVVVMLSTPSVSDFLGITDRRNATLPFAFPASRWLQQSMRMTK